MLSAEDIAAMIRQKLPDARVDVQGDDGRHYAARVESAAFVGLPRVRQHQMVYAALGDLVGGDALHALQLTTATP